MSNHRAVYRNQQGLASFIVVVSMMFIISLIVMSFAMVVRNEQRQTLDRQLSSRAFYAAESGVNMAKKALLANQFPDGKPDCDPDGSVLDSDDYQIGANTETEVTCLTINTTPRTLVKDLGVDNTWVVPLNAATGSLGGLNIDWEPSLVPNNVSYAGCVGTSFPTGAAWGCAAPLLRIDIVTTSGALTMAGLEGSLATFFLYPANGSGQPGYNLADGSGNNKGAIVGARCHPTANSPRDCRIRINGLGSNHYARITSLYRAAKIELSAVNSTGFVGAQAVVDSTGRSVDVLRRIQVRMPLTDDNNAPQYAIFGAAGICKRYTVMPPNVSLDTTNVAGGDFTSNTYNGGRLCDLN